jgi:hypothetical protein
MKRLTPGKTSLALGLICIGLVSYSVYFFLQKPTNDGTWAADQEFLTSATTSSDGKITLTNVRDWIYVDQRVASTTWKTVTIDPNTIRTVWFVTEPFSANKLIGHTFLTFEFTDGSTISFSIEARRRINQDYSAVSGLFHAYALDYSWGTERDFVTRRLLYLEHPVRMYPLIISPQIGKTILEQLVSDTNLLDAHPRFYNTLTANCTNELAKIVNQAVPHALPYDAAWNLTGLADLYLMDHGFISEVHTSKSQTRDRYDFTPYRSEVSGFAAKSPLEFSTDICTLIAST